MQVHQFHDTLNSQSTKFSTICRTFYTIQGEKTRQLAQFRKKHYRLDLLSFLPVHLNSGFNRGK